jgi:hypothetical protein
MQPSILKTQGHVIDPAPTLNAWFMAAYGKYRHLCVSPHAKSIFPHFRGMSPKFTYISLMPGPLIHVHPTVA